MKVLVVDDQSEIVTGILQGIPWQEIGVEAALGACSAQEAKERMRQEKIDILLCDIEMPRESGLELVQEIRASNNNCECIFLTSHANFEYAREALRLNSFEYILKPARYTQIQSVIQQAVNHRLERKRLEILRMYEDYENQITDQMAEYYFRKVLESPDNSRELMDKIFHITTQEEQAGKPCCVAALKIQRWLKDTPRWEDPLLRASISHALLASPLSDTLCFVLLRNTQEQFWLFIYGKKRPVERTEYRNLLDDYVKYEESSLPFRSVIYDGGRMEDAGLFPEILQTVEKLDKSNVTGRTGIITRGEERTSRFSHILISTSGWTNLLIQGKGSIIADTIEEYYRDPRNLGRPESLDFIRSEFIQAVFLALSKMDIPSGAFFSEDCSLDMLSSRTRDSAALVDAVRRTVRRMQEMLDTGDTSIPETRIGLVRDYIRDNLDQKITRSEIAAYMHLNEDYLSRIFKKETGYQLKEYIDMEKIRAAKELLKTTHLSVSMVALKTGFHNFAHFSQIFKKYEGISPSDFRSKTWTSGTERSDS